MSARQTTTITLYKGAPYDDTYKHVIEDTNQEHLTRLNQLTSIVLPASSYQRIDKAIRFPLGLAGNLENLLSYNYLHFKQNGRDFYAFIDDIAYLNDGVALISFNLDIWSTYRFNVDDAQLFIKRSDKGQINDKYIQQITDGEIGSDGSSILTYQQTASFLQSQEAPTLTDDALYWLTFTVTPEKTEKAISTFYGSFSQFDTYILPVGMRTGVVLPIYSGNTLLNPKSTGKRLNVIFQSLSADKRFVGTSQLVQDVSLRPTIGLPISVNYNNIGVTDIHLDTTLTSSSDPNNTTANIKIYTTSVQSGGSSDAKDTQVAQIDLLRLNYIPQNLIKPESFDVNVKNLLQHGIGLESSRDLEFNIKENSMPFSKVEISNGAITFTLDPAFIDGDTVRVWRWGSPFPNSGIYYAVGGYRGVPLDGLLNQFGRLTPGSFDEVAIDDSDYSIPFSTDSYYSFLQANRNQLQNSRTNARILRDQSIEGVRISQANMLTSQGSERQVLAANQALGVTNLRLAQSTQMQNFKQKSDWTLAQAGLGVGMGAFKGAKGASAIGSHGRVTAVDRAKGALGGAGDALPGLGSAMMGQHIEGNILDRNQALAREQMANQNATNFSNLATQQASEREINDRNSAFSTKVATNNYEMTLRSQNAMLQDMKSSSPSTISAGSSFNGSYAQGVAGRWLVTVFKANPAILQIARRYWYLFGNEVDIFTAGSGYPFTVWEGSNKDFGYIRTQGASLSGAIPQSALSILEAMLDNGVTIWKSSAYNNFSLRKQFT